MADLYIYSVATWNSVHAPCCQSTWRNKNHEKYRTRVAGVFLSKANAQEHAKKFGKGYFVEKHKVRDARQHVLETNPHNTEEKKI